ncbi:MAG: hypothetical protein K5634_01600 [Sphaerochaetaceae bacterium]|nr:hypothetical protein [Sphaerochaetaceae bacterium]
MKKPLIIVLLVLTALTPVFALSWHFEADVAACGVLNVPTADYLKETLDKNLISAGFTADANPVGLKFTNLSISGGVSLQYTTKTAAYHNVCLKAVFAYGPDIKITYNFPGSRFSAALKGRMLFCNYINSQDKFLAFNAEAILGYRLGDRDKGIITVLLPLSASIRKDILGITAGIGVNIGADIVFGRRAN